MTESQELRFDLSASALKLSEVVAGEGVSAGKVPILTIARAAGGALPFLIEARVPSDPMRDGSLGVRCGALHANIDRALLARWQGVAATCGALVSRPTAAAAEGDGGAALAWALAFSIDRARCAVRCPWPFPADPARRREYAGEGTLCLDVEALRFVGNTRWQNGEFGSFDVRRIALSRGESESGGGGADGAVPSRVCSYLPLHFK